MHFGIWPKISASELRAIYEQFDRFLSTAPDNIEEDDD